MTAPTPGDPRLWAKSVLTSIEAEGGVLVLLGYSDGSVSMSTDDVISPAVIAGVLRQAADLAESQPEGNQ